MPLAPRRTARRDLKPLARLTRHAVCLNVQWENETDFVNIETNHFVHDVNYLCARSFYHNPSGTRKVVEAINIKCCMLISMGNV